MDYEADIDVLTPHLEYYHGSDARYYAEEINIKWLDNNNVQVSFYATIITTDDMAYRV